MTGKGRTLDRCAVEFAQPLVVKTFTPWPLLLQPWPFWRRVGENWGAADKSFLVVQELLAVSRQTARFEPL